MDGRAETPAVDWFAFRRLVKHVAAFLGGVAASAGVVFPAALLVAAACSRPLTLRIEFARFAALCVLGLLLSAPLAAAAVFAMLSDVQEKKRYAVGDRYRMTAAVGLGHGVFGVCPGLIAVQAYQLTRGNPPPLVMAPVTIAILLWFGGSNYLCGVIAARLARVPRPDTDPCRQCGYDLRATPDRCPECGTVAAEGRKGDKGRKGDIQLFENDVAAALSVKDE
jgi:hypothetical protein